MRTRVADDAERDASHRRAGGRLPGLYLEWSVPLDLEFNDETLPSATVEDLAAMRGVVESIRFEVP